MKIGWIGTGILGSAILKRLSSYVEIFAWNRTLSKVDLLTQFGIKKVSALKDFPNDCEILFLCVKGEETYDEVLFGEEGIAKYLKSDTLIVDLSTISPSTSIYVKNTLETYNLRYVECPVSGGPEGALIGTLTAIMAGDYEDVNKAKEIVKYFCSHMHFVGECGKGQLLKLLNNLAESINCYSLK